MKKLGGFFERAKVFVQKRPLSSFFVSLGLLFLVILLGNFFAPKPQEIPQEEIIKEVSVLSVGETPTFKTLAQVEKEGVIVISSLTQGVVSKIHVSEGDEVKSGKTLISLSTNYAGGNAPSISSQIASKQFQNIKDTFDSQNEIIKKQKEVAEKNATNTEELRKIAVSANDDAKSLLSLNEGILSTIDTNLNNLINNNTGGANDALILQTRLTKAQVLQGINSLKSAIKSADFANNTDNAPTQLANLNKDIAIKQLEIQEKALVLNKEISQLQLSLASISEAMMFPSSPRSGTIQKIHVNEGQLVNPGTPLVTIYAPSGNVKAIVRVGAKIASRVSLTSMSHLVIDGENLMVISDFISSEAIDGNLHQIIYNIPPNLAGKLSDGEFITVEVPLDSLTTSGAFPFVPLDSVFQTQENTYLYVVEDEKAVSRSVTLGEVFGSDVEVKDGLGVGDKVILNRNVLAGDKVVIK